MLALVLWTCLHLHNELVRRTHYSAAAQLDELDDEATALDIDIKRARKVYKASKNSEDRKYYLTLLAEEERLQSLRPQLWAKLLRASKRITSSSFALVVPSVSVSIVPVLA